MVFFVKYKEGWREARREKMLRREEQITESRILVMGHRPREEMGIGRSKSHDLVCN